MKSKIKEENWRLGKKIILTLVGFVVISISSVLVINAFTPVPLVSFLQKTKMVAGEVNSFEPKSNPIEKILKDRTLYLSEIQYGENYPNSYLDIYIPDGDAGTERPTFFYVHGGGFAWGEKVEGNPLAPNPIDENTPLYLTTVAKKGYNVVSMNYALTPDYQYPVPLCQLDEAVKFLQKNQELYGLDLTEIIFAGGSAGGQIVGQYVNIQTNPAYAKEMNMTPLLDKHEIKAVVFNSALLDAKRFDQTGDFTKNLVFSALGRIYFDTNHLKDSPAVKESNVISHISEEFPPVFISDGNTATFTDQAFDLQKRLTELSIPHMFNYYEKKEVPLPHEYELDLENPYAAENLTKTLDFLDEVTDM